MTIPCSARTAGELGPALGIADLAALVAQGGVLALTGAGLSTDSGIPDYRGPDGHRRIMPMTIEEFRGSSAGRARYWSRSHIGWPLIREAQPNSGHRALAQLEGAGLLDAVITQNVDGLHQKAGSRRVHELHGSLAKVVCLACRARLERDRLHAVLARLNPGFAPTVGAAHAPVRPDGDVDLTREAEQSFRLARCEDCDSDLLKPDVVFFGESVPKTRVEQCFDAVAESRSLVVLGSSLAVMSGLRFVRRAAALGKPIAIVTRGSTRADELATIRIDAGLGEVLPRLAEALTGPGR